MTCVSCQCILILSSPIMMVKWCRLDGMLGHGMPGYGALCWSLAKASIPTDITEVLENQLSPQSQEGTPHMAAAGCNKNILHTMTLLHSLQWSCTAYIAHAPSLNVYRTVFLTPSLFRNSASRTCACLDRRK